MDNSRYYNFFDWENVKGQGHGPLLIALKSSIPADVQTILDVGCGNGVITNELALHYDVTGVDRSEKAISFLEGKKILANCDQIPVADSSFDMVMSTEMLEHLESPVLHRTVEEFKRISKKYILISVPHAENIKKMHIKCPDCGYVYNRIYHLQSFTRKSLENLFPQYEVLNHQVIGAMVRTYHRGLVHLKHKYTPASSWIPFFWIPNNNRKSFCPNCETTFEYRYKFHLMGLMIDLANIVISRKKPYWQVILFRKKND